MNQELTDKGIYLLRELIAIQIEMEGMRVANMERELRGMSLAYGEEAFTYLQSRLRELS